MRALVLVLVLLAAVSYAEPPESAASAEPAASPEPVANPVLAASPPPAATHYVDLRLRWQGGALSLENIEKGRFPTPTRLKRFLGRFEARVLVGGKPQESVRFDFPLLGVADAGEEQALDAALRAHLSTVTVVRVPLGEKAEAIEVVDTRAAAGESGRLLIPLGRQKAAPNPGRAEAAEKRRAKPARVKPAVPGRRK